MIPEQQAVIAPTLNQIVILMVTLLVAGTAWSGNQSVDRRPVSPQSEPVLKVQLREIHHTSEGFGTSVAYHPDGQRWVSALQGLITFHQDEKVLTQIQLPEVYQLRFNPDGGLLLAAPSIYDLSTGAEVPLPLALSTTLNRDGNTYEVVDAAFSESGSQMVVSARYRPPRGLDRRAVTPPGPRVQVLLVDGYSRQLIRILHQGGSTPLGRVALSSRYAAAGDVGLWLWSLAGQEPPRRLELGSNTLRRILFSADSSLVFACDAGGQVGMWSTGDGALLSRWQSSVVDTSALALHPNLPLVITGDGDGMVKVWDLHQLNTPVFSISHPGPIRGINLDPTGRRMLVVVGGSRNVIVEYSLEQVQ